MYVGRKNSTATMVLALDHDIDEKSLKDLLSQDEILEAKKVDI